jgi:DNA mismatch repair protein MutL
VIDRPASVVKELIENSIDAGADRISVILRDGGRDLIQIIDNGVGMNEQDAIMSLQRHATSKIRKYQDVEKILSLGFRGEALASIASVSRLELKTIEKGHMQGTAISIEGGTVEKMEAAGGNSGSSIAVKNLFFNTPARRKFLRTPSTEYRYILSMINRFTLSYPRIGFNVVNEGAEVYGYKPSDLKERIGDVLGQRIQNNLIQINDLNALMNITGYVGNFDVLRKSRNDQYLFVNNRYINDRTISAALAAAFGETIPKGSFPLYIIFIEIDPERVDVNVHPTKSEVKFADQHMIFSLMRGAVKRTLISDNIIPEMITQTGLGGIAPQNKMSTSIYEQMKDSDVHQTKMDFESPSIKNSPIFSPDRSKNPTSEPFRPTPESSRPAEARAPLWQLHSKYILSQIKSGMVVIDQHVAHERILYEQAKESFQNRKIPVQQLLFPQTIDLDPVDHAALMEILPFLEKIGFLLKSFGGNTVVVEGVPSGLRIGNENKILLDILDEYKKNEGSEVDIQERVAKSFACRSAIMAGDKLTYEEMASLIDQLFSSQNPYFCPHGRPVMLTFSLEEFDKRFDRT